MDKTKANIRAIREACGMTQSDVSGETGATVGVVRSWEDPSCGVLPPDDVWAWLLMARDALVMDARDAVEQIMATRNGQTVALPYFPRRTILMPCSWPRALTSRLATTTRARA